MKVRIDLAVEVNLEGEALEAIAREMGVHPGDVTLDSFDTLLRRSLADSGATSLTRLPGKVLPTQIIDLQVSELKQAA